MKGFPDLDFGVTCSWVRWGVDRGAHPDQHPGLPGCSWVHPGCTGCARKRTRPPTRCGVCLEFVDPIGWAEEAVNVKNLRKAMVPQARPMPLFDRPFVPQRSSRELTRPQSPKLRVLHRKDQRQSLTSSVQKQSQMR
eukprot:Gb_27942 [translate_table: standard]